MKDTLSIARRSGLAWSWVLGWLLCACSETTVTDVIEVPQDTGPAQDTAGPQGDAEANAAGVRDNPGVDVIYLANAGFLLQGPEGNVLIDALFSDPATPWRAHSPQTLDALTQPRKPFDQVDVVIVTHSHNDHYDTETVAKHLRGNPKAQLITTAAVGADLAEKLPDFTELEPRIHAQTPLSDQRVELEVAGISFTLMYFSHGPKSSAENLGVMFELGGTRILHAGDCVASVDQVTAYKLPEEGIDVLFVPYWMLLRPFMQETIRTGIAPGTIVGMHFEPRTVMQKHVMDRGGWDSFFEMLQNEFPELVIIEEPAAKVHFQ